jgi:hypothetical protein
VVEATRTLGIPYAGRPGQRLRDRDPLRRARLADGVLVDRRGIVRYRHIGKGAYEETEAMIRRLLAERGAP